MDGCQLAGIEARLMTWRRELTEKQGRTLPTDHPDLWNVEGAACLTMCERLLAEVKRLRADQVTGGT